MSKEKFFAINLARLRELKKWSQDKLAREADVSKHTVFRAESKNKIPRGNNIEKIAKALGVSPSELFRNPNSDQNENQKQQLFFAIVSRLATMNEDELRIIDGFISDAFSDALSRAAGSDA